MINQTESSPNTYSNSYPKKVKEVNIYLVEGQLLIPEYLLSEGDVFKVESNLNHSIQTLTEFVKLIDGFSPIREDFLSS